MTDNKTTRKSGINQFTDLKTILVKYFYHWPLFLLGLILALGAAFIYLQIKNPEYNISATILVKDEKKTPQEKSNLQELELSTSPRSAETEIQVITSKKIISQVVNDLGLYITYTAGDFFNTRDLYGTAPVKLEISRGSGIVGKHEISILIQDANNFTVKRDNLPSIKGKFNETIETDFGKWILKATQSLNQYIGTTVKITISDPEKTTDGYAKSLEARLLDKSAPTIGLFLTDESPRRGKNFLNALIKSYNQATATEERRITKSTIDFIDKRLASLTGELSAAENKVEGYRSSKGLTDVGLQSKVYLENQQSNDAKLNDVNVQLSNIYGIERYVNSPANTSPPATLGIEDEALASLIKNLTALQLKRVELLTSTPEGNPLFEPINMQIKTTKSAIRANIGGIKASLLGEKRQLQSVNRKFESSIKEIPGQEREYVGMKRQQSSKENLYVYLLQKREELALSYASTQADARIVDSANVGEVKWPRIPLVVAIALILGLIIPFMIIYFRYAFNRKITTREEIENALDVPIIGEISYEYLGKDIVLIDNPRHLVAEQFRSIRTNLYNLHKKRAEKLQNLVYDNIFKTRKTPGRITLCTSSTASEGKSFIASNLAVSIAATGRKTILLEMDLRKPSVMSLFNMDEDKPGISEFLSSSITTHEIIQHSGIHKDFYMIGSGKIRHNPSELLEGPRLRELLAILQKHCDDIIIDSPPLHLVTDAMIIGRLADISLYVIRQGYTSKQELEFIRELSSSDQLPEMNIIFNGITQGKYGYGYNYNDSYYTEMTKGKNFKNSWKHFMTRF
ncbi:polysaccharide biosynthesis tyrosine autokinase [Pedobacter frigoris]|uniref:GumC family protein n=1 Tax=Pedobacter frigoris TaxID=2571272 RepID=UPI0029316E4E|nr:polysaccharide biosynthesis tyrosine autokinase [Pedobacter frigoris]